MQTIVMEFDNEQQMREAQSRLWDKEKVTGEMGAKPLAGGRWRLELITEKPIKESLLEKLPGKVVQPGRGGEAGPAAAPDDGVPGDVEGKG